MHFGLAITNACDAVKWVSAWLVWIVREVLITREFGLGHSILL
jgi:hypothetical protein